MAVGWMGGVGWVDGWTHRCMDGQADRHMDRRKDRQSDGRLIGQTDGQTDKWLMHATWTDRRLGVCLHAERH